MKSLKLFAGLFFVMVFAVSAYAQGVQDVNIAGQDQPVEVTTNPQHPFNVSISDQPVEVYITNKTLQVEFANNSSQIPWQGSGANSSADFGITVSISAPSGHLLVIDNFTVFASVGSADDIARANIRTSMDGSTVGHHFSMRTESVGRGSRTLTGGETRRLFHHTSDGPVNIELYRNNDAFSFSAQASITGYLVPLPAPL